MPRPPDVMLSSTCGTLDSSQWIWTRLQSCDLGRIGCSWVSMEVEFYPESIGFNPVRCSEQNTTHWQLQPVLVSTGLIPKHKTITWSATETSTKEDTLEKSLLFVRLPRCTKVIAVSLQGQVLDLLVCVLLNAQRAKVNRQQVLRKTQVRLGQTTRANSRWSFLRSTLNASRLLLGPCQLCSHSHSWWLLQLPLVWALVWNLKSKPWRRKTDR